MLIVAEVMETPDSLGDGTVMLEESRTTEAKVCMKPDFC